MCKYAFKMYPTLNVAAYIENAINQSRFRISISCQIHRKFMYPTHFAICIGRERELHDVYLYLMSIPVSNDRDYLEYIYLFVVWWFYLDRYNIDVDRSIDVCL